MDLPSSTRDSSKAFSNKLSNSVTKSPVPRKSILSNQSVHFEEKFSFLSNQTESLKLTYQVDLLLTENKQLHLKLEQMEKFFKSEVKKRDELIISMTGMMKDREEQFKKILTEQESEKNKIIGKKESEKLALKRSISELKYDTGLVSRNDIIQKQEKELENLRTILKMTEKENKNLFCRVQEFDEESLKNEKKKNEEFLKDICFELGILVDSLDRFKAVLSKIIKDDFSVELALTTIPSRDEIFKDNIIESLKKSVLITRGIQDFILDIYAGKCGNNCHVQ